MKKTVALLLALILGLSLLAGCGGNSGNGETEPAQTPESTPPAQEAAKTPEPKPEVIKIVPVELTFGDYGLDYDLDYIGADQTFITQPMSEERLSSATLNNFYDHFKEFIDDPFSMTYEEIAPWVGCEASYMTVHKEFGQRTYHWVTSEKASSKMHLSFKEKDGKWVFDDWGGANLK